MTSFESIAHAVERVFKNTMFIRKNMIEEHLSLRCPTIGKFKLEDGDNPETSFLTVFYDDVTIKSKITWRRDANGVYYILVKNEIIEIINN